MLRLLIIIISVIYHSRSESIEHPNEILDIPSKCLGLSNSSDLVRLIILCRIDGQLAGELARSVVDLIARRKREFAKLTVRDVCRESTYLLMVSFFNRSSLFVHCRFWIFLWTT